MLRSIVLATVILLAPTTLFAQQSGSGKAVRQDHKLSVAGGIGFLADVNSTPAASAFGVNTSQFLMQFDAMYSLTNNISVGSVLQIGPASGSSTIAMTAEGRFYLPLGDGDNIVGKLAPYGGLGLGFRSYTGTFGSTDFLFPMILGIEYDLTDRLSITSDMRFNITSGHDRFYFSWQLAGARFRF